MQGLSLATMNHQSLISRVLFGKMEKTIEQKLMRHFANNSKKEYTTYFTWSEEIVKVVALSISSPERRSEEAEDFNFVARFRLFQIATNLLFSRLLRRSDRLKCWSIALARAQIRLVRCFLLLLR